MENIEFIAAKDLPTTEAEEVDVLCVDPETGEMKRKPGASLGSSKGYVLMFDPENDTPGEADNGITVTIAGNCDEVADVLEKGGTVWFDMTAVAGTFMRVCINAWSYQDGVLVLMTTMDGATITITCPNITWAPPTA